MGLKERDLLKKEAGIFTFNDLLEYFPFRHIDKTQITTVNKITPDAEYVQVSWENNFSRNNGRKKRQTACGELI